MLVSEENILTGIGDAEASLAIVSDATNSAERLDNVLILPSAPLLNSITDTIIIPRI